MTPAEHRMGRILVALDASPCSLAVLEIAARLAAALEAELSGLYVEDETLLRGAELPITNAVGSFSGAVRQLERPELERHLRIQAAKAKHALETIGNHARVPWSFQVARGAVTQELLLAANDADIVSLGQCGWSLIGSSRMGITTETVLARADAPVLVHRSGLRAGRSVVAVYDGSEAAHIGLTLGTQVAHDGGTPLVIVLPTSGQNVDRLRSSAQNELEALEVDRRVGFRTVVRQDAVELGGVAHGEDAGILILPTTDVFEKGFKELLTRLQCPLLVVRR